MSVYMKRGRNGKPSTICVEVQANGQRARGYFSTMEEARKAEKEWKAGRFPEEAKTRVDPAGVPKTLHALTRKAYGYLWSGKAIETTRYRQLDTMVEYLGDLPLEELTTSKIDELQKLLLRRGLKRITLNKYYSCLSTLLKWGNERGYVKVLPKFPREEEEEGRIREITEAEEFRLTGLLAAYGRQDIADLITVAIRTGLRKGELLNVRLPHIEHDQVTIWKSKNKKARTVPMEPETTAMLRALVLAGMPTGETIRYWWDKAKEDMGIDDDHFVFHACRHTCCTRLIRAGVNPVVAQKWMGHKVITTTLRYTHLNDGDLKTALKTLSQFPSSSTAGNIRRDQPHPALV